ncbi:glycosyltransferase family 4 protein [Pseudanabaena sp. UWO311]|uniref:glycosyltransferase family 4 protein n=1 Tax=Pseudanabaena sp. UWO311 TaxID=2487337 RepID=UPI00115775B3|nr:glycosyltransferase family 1 protein [Pseudanabaena sp. UWO311]TYQ26990.1 glycosyltransferase family 4 protein [Pseudanabaena sp. UWO311]
MRIFIDCTHTATYTYKNTGIHRVVRQITSELLHISSISSNLEVIPVKFDGDFITKVFSLDEPELNHTSQDTKDFFKTKIVKKLLSYFHRLKNKVKKVLPDYVVLTYKNDRQSKLRQQYKFAGVQFSSSDIYLIVDANWDLPRSYYHFLQHLKSCNVSITSICYDLIPIKFPEFCPKDFVKAFKDFYCLYSDCFDQVICISNKSADDYIQAKQDGVLPNINKNQIVSSFRLGSDYSGNRQAENTAQNNIANSILESLNGKKYILVVGSLVPHKNIKTIINAFDLLIESNDDINLVFAGNRGWHSDTDILIEKNKRYGRNIYIFDSVTDVDLDDLYTNCYCLVQASFYEGFGLPVVEALQHGKPVISSNGGSLPEVGGDFCIYFDPNEPKQLYQFLEQMVNSDEFYSHLVKRIRMDYSDFSWKDSAKQLLALLSDYKNVRIE